MTSSSTSMAMTLPACLYPILDLPGTTLVDVQRLGTGRFNPESTFGANAGLEKAREKLEPIKKKFDWITCVPS